MLTSAVLASLAAPALATLPNSEPVEFACGNALPSKEFLDTSSKLRAAEHSLTSQGELAAAEILLDTHIHIVAANNTADSGYASVSASLWTPDNQTQTRPPPSRDSPKSKKLMPSSPPVARSHPRPDGRPEQGLREQRHQVRPQVPRPHHQRHLVQRLEEEAMKKALRKGRYHDLNLYFSKQPMGRFGVLGYCTLPQWAPRGSDAFESNGCVVSVDTLPGGAFRE
ncbi:hypothetical protein X797_003090 [Metarhizium robertsii]|uniref:Metalloprotease MEP1 n=2 Tax=Metarhizium robertsii TaxID=568076 RepID=E9ETL9_METRA|nr:metalloprotease MEP1 [Metarhizium robertsii ARSEF 23]EFZ00772.1 metalloprotease MEP1 [Metarhizium robertsii ARSEF 23]EXV03290.1 hypothetical protein X797_003090 [Metarhizium robertsii]